MRIFLIVYLISILWPTDVFAFERKYPLIQEHDINLPMKFKYVGSGCNRVYCEWVYAIGKITKNTPEELKKFMEEERSTPTIYFNSNGGDLIASLALGELIRKFGVNTSIGNTNRRDEREDDTFPRMYELSEGVCLSACAYAFLGGVRRDIYDNNKYGIHQFYDPTSLKRFEEKTANQLDRTADQIITGIILDYVVRMGVKPKLASTASKQNPEGMYYVTQKQQQDWNVTNSEDKYSKPVIIPFGRNGAVLETKYISGYYANYENPTRYRLYCKGKNKVPHLAIIGFSEAQYNKSSIWAGIIQDVKYFQFTDKDKNIIYSEAKQVSKQSKKASNKEYISWAFPDLTVLDFSRSVTIEPHEESYGMLPTSMWSYIPEMSFNIKKNNRLLKIALNSCIE